MKLNEPVTVFDKLENDVDTGDDYLPPDNEELHEQLKLPEEKVLPWEEIKAHNMAARKSATPKSSENVKMFWEVEEKADSPLPIEKDPFAIAEDIESKVSWEEPEHIINKDLGPPPEYNDLRLKIFVKLKQTKNDKY